MLSGAYGEALRIYGEHEEMRKSLWKVRASAHAHAHARVYAHASREMRTPVREVTRWAGMDSRRAGRLGMGGA